MVGVGVGVRGNKIDEKEKKLHVDQDQRRIRVGKYEVGKTLGEGNFGKVKFALNLETGEPFALKVLDKNKIIHLNIADQIKREIGSLKLLKHPNVVRLHEVLASKTKIYMVLEYVTGGELFDRIASKGKLSEGEARKIFQQLIDGISYCHTKGVFHRDLKLENILVDAKGNIKISDFGLSALPQHFRDDGLLHTTCGSPNYVAPEVLSNRGYDGVTSDIWSCGVILYVILSGYLPFDDRNLTVLYQKIFKGDYEVAKWISKGAQNLMRKILDPNPISRINIAAIKRDEWFQKDYHPNPPNSLTLTLTLDHEDHEEIIINTSDPCTTSSSILINAFQLIGMSSWLDLSGFFEKEDVSERKIRFTSNHYSAKEDLLKRMEDIVTHMGFLVHNKQGRLKVVREAQKNSLSRILLVSAEVFKITPSLFVVELIKSFGDSSSYRQLCEILSGDLGVPRREL